MVKHYPVGEIVNLGQIITELHIAGDRLLIQSGVMKEWSERFYALSESLKEWKDAVHTSPKKT